MPWDIITVGEDGKGGVMRAVGHHHISDEGEDDGVVSAVGHHHRQ